MCFLEQVQNKSCLVIETRLVYAFLFSGWNEQWHIRPKNEYCHFFLFKHYSMDTFRYGLILTDSVLSHKNKSSIVLSTSASWRTCFNLILTFILWCRECIFQIWKAWVEWVTLQLRHKMHQVQKNINPPIWCQPGIIKLS